MGGGKRGGEVEMKEVDDEDEWITKFDYARAYASYHYAY